MALTNEKLAVTLELDDRQARKAIKDLKAQLHKNTDVDTQKVEKAQKGQKKLLDDMTKSLAKFEILKAVARDIKAKIDEGYKNLYEYSKLTGGQLAKSLDKFESVTSALGNAFAVIRGMFAQAVLPHLNVFVEKLITLVNYVSRIIAELFDLPDYLQARSDILVQWATNIKETRQLISGFDKLNVFSGTRNTFPRDMFYTVKNDGQNQGWAEMTAWLKVELKNLWDWLKGLGEKIGIWFKDKIWPVVVKWWNGESVYDEEEGRYIHYEAGAKERILTFLQGAWKKFLLWFRGDPETGQEGVWQKEIWPTIKDAWDVVRKFLAEQFDKIGTAIGNWWNNTDVGKGLRNDKEVVGTTLYGLANLLPWNWWKVQTGERPETGNVFKNASGGVYTQPTLGLVAEYSGASHNPELITPTDLLDDRLQENNKALLSAFYSMTGEIVSAIGDMNMEVRIGDDVIARSASRGNEAYYKMMGRPLIR